MNIDIAKVKAVRLKVTLKKGEEVWQQGEVLNTPLPKTIIGELQAGNSTVEVLSVIDTENGVVAVKPVGNKRLVV